MWSPAGAVLLHEFFDRQWSQWRDRIAIDIPPGPAHVHRSQATYAELADRSQAVTDRLDTLIQGECVVAVLLPRTSVDAFAAPLGILRAGGAYVSLDPSAPDERIEAILADSAALAIITDGSGAARLEQLGVPHARVIDMASLATAVRAPEGSASARPWLSPSALAYLIYTSGTTGRPKGVMIEHRAIVNLVDSDREEFQLSANDRVGQGSSHAYDSSLEEIWLAWAAGATLVVMADDVARAGPDLVPWLERERVTVLCPPPTLLRATGRRDSGGLLPALHLLYVGGEALSDDVVNVWAPGRRLVNGYGPTECAVTSVRTDIRTGEPVTIGRPIPNVGAHIVNDNLEDVEDGEVGELCLSGAALARGYRNDPQLSAAKFPSHPVHGRMYRTGDLARREANGVITCLGRLDSQVKIRGHRIELDEIDARLAACAGVRAAATTVQVQGGRQTLVAFIVPQSAGAPPDLTTVRNELAAVLPAYMVPAHFALTPALPTTVGGKIDRKALPNATLGSVNDTVTLPTTELERRIELALRRITDRATPISVDANFFIDVGGDSLLAAELITALRDDPQTASLTVRDAYEAPTITQLASRAAAMAADTSEPVVPQRAGGGQPVVATAIQMAWLVFELVLVAGTGSVAVMTVWPWAMAHATPLRIALGFPLAGILVVLAYLPLSVWTAVLIKRLVIGRYQAGQAPVWGRLYIRHWLVCQAVRLVPWRLIEGTEFQLAALRALGARIGARVHIHRGVDLMQGGWDLLDIGDDVTIGQEAVIRLVDLEDEQLVSGPIRVASGATVETRASLAGDSAIEAGGYLTALSSLTSGARIPAGERWDGVPARPAGPAPAVPVIPNAERQLSPLSHGALMLGTRLANVIITPTLLLLSFIAIGQLRGLSTTDLTAWLSAPIWHAEIWWIAVLAGAVSVPVSLAVQAVACRALGRLRPAVISRWSVGYVFVWTKTDLVRRAGDWLSGTLMWPMWLRAAGMRIGRDCEMSTIIDVVPELVAIGEETFFADGIYIGGPRMHRGTVTLEQTTIGSRVFIGNHVVIPSGTHLASDVLIGVSTVANDAQMMAGTSWFGHPPFPLARPPQPYLDRKLTHQPGLLRRANRWIWELGRFLIPVAPTVVALAIAHLLIASPVDSLAGVAILTAPAAAIAAMLALAGVVLTVKWTLLGRVRPGQHPLWSCWCSRWDFMYMVWARLAYGFTSRLEGTLVLAWYLRAMGMRIGKRVVLGPGFAQVVDPDMIRIDDDATVHALFQAHTFEDRMLKIDRVRIRARATVGCGAVLFYGVDVGEDASVAAQSVIMKQERLLPRRTYEGCPSAPKSKTAPQSSPSRPHRYVRPTAPSADRALS